VVSRRMAQQKRPSCRTRHRRLGRHANVERWGSEGEGGGRGGSGGRSPSCGGWDEMLVMTGDVPCAASPGQWEAVAAAGNLGRDDEGPCRTAPEEGCPPGRGRGAGGGDRTARAWRIDALAGRPPITTVPFCLPSAVLWHALLFPSSPLMLLYHGYFDPKVVSHCRSPGYERLTATPATVPHHNTSSSTAGPSRMGDAPGSPLRTHRISLASRPTSESCSSVRSTADAQRDLEPILPAPQL